MDYFVQCASWPSHPKIFFASKNIFSLLPPPSNLMRKMIKSYWHHGEEVQVFRDWQEEEMWGKGKKCGVVDDSAEEEHVPPRATGRLPTLSSMKLPPPTARPHRRPAEGDSEKSPPCRDYKRLRPSVPHHLITRPTPSHWVVRLQSVFFTKHLRRYSTDASDDDPGSRQTRHGTVREEAIFDVKIQGPATNQPSTEQCANRLI